MTCGECKHLREIKRGASQHICIAQYPIWLLEAAASSSAGAYRKPQDDGNFCPCFVAKEGE